MVPPEHLLFEICSITKVFTFVLLLEMEREKLLSRVTWSVSLCQTLKRLFEWDYIEKYCYSYSNASKEENRWTVAKNYWNEID